MAKLTDQALLLKARNFAERLLERDPPPAGAGAPNAGAAGAAALGRGGERGALGSISPSRQPRAALPILRSQDMTALIRDQVRDAISAALDAAQRAGALPRLATGEVTVERPTRPEHGDYASNIALRIASTVGRRPMEVAEAIIGHVEQTAMISSVEVATPGFINVRLAPPWTLQQLPAIVAAGAEWGNIDLGRGRRLQVEFVSANPTGPPARRERPRGHHRGHAGQRARCRRLSGGTGVLPQRHGRPTARLRRHAPGALPAGARAGYRDPGRGLSRRLHGGTGRAPPGRVRRPPAGGRR